MLSELWVKKNEDKFLSGGGETRELQDRSNKDNSLRMMLLEKFRTVLPILMMAKLLVFSVTVRLLFF